MASNSITGLGIHPVWRVSGQEGWPYNFKGCSVNGNEEIFLGKQPIPRVHPTHQTVRQLWNEFLFCLVVKRPHRCFSNKVFNKKLKHFDSFPKNQEFLQYPVIAGTSLRGQGNNLDWVTMSSVPSIWVGDPTKVIRAISWAVDQGAWFQRIFHRARKRVVNLKHQEKEEICIYRWQILQYIQYISPKKSTYSIHISWFISWWWILSHFDMVVQSTRPWRTTSKQWAKNRNFNGKNRVNRWIFPATRNIEGGYLEQAWLKNGEAGGEKKTP